MLVNQFDTTFEIFQYMDALDLPCVPLPHQTYLKTDFQTPDRLVLRWDFRTREKGPLFSLFIITKTEDTAFGSIIWQRTSRLSMSYEGPTVDKTLPRDEWISMFQRLQASGNWTLDYPSYQDSLEQHHELLKDTITKWYGGMYLFLTHPPTCGISE